MKEVYNFPWFPFYPADWFSSGRVKIMTLQEKGAYMELLLYAWKSDACALPKHEAVLKSLASWQEQEYLDIKGVNPHNFQRVMDCFEEHPENPEWLCNPRLYREWLRAIEQHRKLSSRGKKGAKKRWHEKPETLPAVTTPPRSKPRLTDRSSAGFESVSAIADKHFKPIP